jgi:2-polyprenyl-3-methyl-5-hydroxy-6-metoxy-1,4-benzoquinol methylase
MELKKFKEKKIFATGVSGSGKSTFSKKYSQEFNVEYFDFETNWGGYINKIENQYEKLVAKYPEEFIMDAIPYTSNKNDRMNFLDYYDENKDDVKIICICCTNKDEFDKRLESKFYGSKIRAYSEYHHFYYDTVKNLYTKLNIVYLDSSTDEWITEEELYKRIQWINIDNLRIFIKDNLKTYIDELKYDKYYEDIECINFIGYTKSHKTWDNIKDLVDWKGKKVADLGCFHSYFAFKAAKAGAIVTGLDTSSEVLITSHFINEVEGNIISLKQWTGGEEVSSDFDITLCLNVFHYFADKKKSLQNIKSKIVIFEVNQELVDIISEEFNIIKRLRSHRPDFKGIERVILLCEKK